LPAALLGGCTSVLTEGTAAGASTAGAGISRAVTRNAGATGIGQAAARAGLQYAERRIHQAEQDAIASEIATMAPGGHRPWHIDHTIPIGNEHGEVRVMRDIPNRLTPRKEQVFSVESGKAEEAKHAWHTTQACRSGARWKWALAEPATGRWESLQ
jgi:hypothetical protein